MKVQKIIAGGRHLYSKTLWNRHPNCFWLFCIWHTEKGFVSSIKQFLVSILSFFILNVSILLPRQYIRDLLPISKYSFWMYLPFGGIEKLPTKDSSVSVGKSGEKSQCKKLLWFIILFHVQRFPPFMWVHTAHHWLCEGLCLLIGFLWVRRRPRTSHTYWSASRPICLQKQLGCSLSVSPVKVQATFHFTCMPLQKSKERSECDRMRERQQVANESFWVEGKISWLEKNVTTEDKRPRQRLLFAYLTCY